MLHQPTIVGIDGFDTLLADRPYRKGMGTIEAMSTIVASAGSHFDPKVVDALQKIINRGGEQAVRQRLQSPGAAILRCEVPIRLSRRTALIEEKSGQEALAANHDRRTGCPAKTKPCEAWYWRSCGGPDGVCDVA